MINVFVKLASANAKQSDGESELIAQIDLDRHKLSTFSFQMGELNGNWHRRWFCVSGGVNRKWRRRRRLPRAINSCPFDFFVVVFFFVLVCKHEQTHVIIQFKLSYLAYCANTAPRTHRVNKWSNFVCVCVFALRPWHIVWKQNVKTITTKWWMRLNGW